MLPGMPPPPPPPILGMASPFVTPPTMAPPVMASPFVAPPVAPPHIEVPHEEVVVREPTILGDYDIKRIAHLSDIHIRHSPERHQEYAEVLEAAVQQIGERASFEGDTLVVVTGDVFHEKRFFSQSSLELCYKWLLDLRKVAPVVVIPGNHDMIEQKHRGEDRLELVTHLVGQHPNGRFPVWYLKKCDAYRLRNVVMVCSELDGSEGGKWLPRDQVRARETDWCIALHHGIVSGGATEKGKKLSGGRPLRDFRGYDLVLLGDIHKHQLLSPGVAYAGSLLQQNHGESLEGHGWVEWRLGASKLDGIGSPRHHSVPNRYGFITIEAREGMFRVPDSVPEKPRIRYLMDNLTSIDQMEHFHQELLEKYPGIAGFTLSHRRKKEREGDGDRDGKTEGEGEGDDEESKGLDIGVELQKYLPEELLDLHREVLGAVSIDLGVPEAKSSFQLEGMKFRNVLSYPDKWHTIDFTSQHGITLISGLNHSGKSNLIKMLINGLYGVSRSKPGQFNSTDWVNRYSDSPISYIEVFFSCRDTHYRVKRTIQVSKASLKYIVAELSVGTVGGVGEETWQSVLSGSSVKALDLQLAELIGDRDTFTNTSIFNNTDVVPVIDDTPRRAAESLVGYFRLDRLTELYNYAKGRVGSSSAELESDRMILHNLQSQLDQIKGDASFAKAEAEQHDMDRIDTEIGELQAQVTQMGGQIGTAFQEVTRLSALLMDVSHYPNFEEISRQLEQLSPDLPDAEQIEVWDHQIRIAFHELQQCLQTWKISLSDELSEGERLRAHFEGLRPDLVEQSQGVPDGISLETIREKLAVVRARWPEAIDCAPMPLGPGLDWVGMDRPSQLVRVEPGQCEQVEQQLQDLETKLDLKSWCELLRSRCNLGHSSVELSQGEAQQLLRTLEWWGGGQSSQGSAELTRLREQLRIMRESEIYWRQLPMAASHYQALLGMEQRLVKLGQLRELESSSDKLNRWLELKCQEDRMHQGKLRNRLLGLQSQLGEYLERIEHNEKIQLEIDDLQTEMSQKQGLMSQLQNRIQELQIPKQELIQQRERRRLLEERQAELEHQLVVSRGKIEVGEVEVERWKQYRQLVSRTGIPIKLLEQQLGKLRGCINDILSDMTDYQIRLDLNHKDTYSEVRVGIEKLGRVFGKSQLSGYETFILRVAVKFALNRIGYLQTSGLLCIDEGLDCIDRHNWSRVTRLLQSLRMVYRNILLITHLDAVEDLPAHRIRVRLRGPHSQLFSE